MRIATWNVNSIKARLERVLAWLDRQRPDVVCLQELKTTEAQFPFKEIENAGYHAAVSGQKTYNGVAILSREEPRDVAIGMRDGFDDPQARLVAASVADARVFSIYVPNGGAVGSEKWAYKLEWLTRLQRMLAKTADVTAPLVLCGDFNIAPEEQDVCDPAAWEQTVLFHPEARRAFRALIAWGLVDIFRRHNAEGGLYSWWDYRMLAFPKNIGLRIDHILVTRRLAAKCTGVSIDRQERKGKLPSDHAPVIAAFDWP